MQRRTHKKNETNVLNFNLIHSMQKKKKKVPALRVFICILRDGDGMMSFAI